MVKICIVEGSLETLISYNNPLNTDNVIHSNAKKLDLILDVLRIPYCKYTVDFKEKSFNSVCQEINKIYIEERIDCFFMLFDTGSQFIKLIDYMESNGMPHTGTSSFHANISRECMKQICINNCIPTPKHYFAYDYTTFVAEKGFIESTLSYPIFVKNQRSTDSIGITDKSLCHSWEELANSVQTMFHMYSNGALLEEYIPGNEFNTFCVGNPRIGYQSFPDLNIENLFDESSPIKYKTYDYKYNSDFVLDHKQVIDPHLDVFHKKIIDSFRFDGYYRCDIRQMDGRYYLIDINPYPTMYDLINEAVYTMVKESFEKYCEITRCIIDEAMCRPYCDKKYVVLVVNRYIFIPIEKNTMQIEKINERILRIQKVFENQTEIDGVYEVSISLYNREATQSATKKLVKKLADVHDLLDLCENPYITKILDFEQLPLSSLITQKSCTLTYETERITDPSNKSQSSHPFE